MRTRQVATKSLIHLNGKLPATVMILKMVALLVSVAMVCGFQTPQKSLLQQVAPNPTGNNGYEEFLMGADALGGYQSSNWKGVGFYLNWTPNTYEELLEAATAKPEPGAHPDVVRMMEEDRPKPDQLAFAKRLDAMTMLQVKQEMVSKFRPVLELVRRGLRKRVWDPRQQPSQATLYPELASFKAIARFMTSAAHVAFANGQASEGADLLLDALQFGASIRDSSLISSLVGQAIVSISLAIVEQNLDSIPLAASIRMTELGSRLMLTDAQVVKILNGEIDSNERTVYEFARSPESIGLDDEENPELKRLLRDLAASSSEQRTRWARMVREQAAASYRRAFALLKSPESEWTRTPPESPEVEEEAWPPKNVERLILNVLDLLTVSDSNYLAFVAKARCHARLLGLHGAVLRFKWENQKLPSALSEVATLEQIRDPLSRQDFVYERQGFHGFRIYSRGSQETGEIALRYRRAASAEPDEPPPPMGLLHK